MLNKLAGLFIGLFYVYAALFSYAHGISAGSPLLKETAVKVLIIPLPLHVELHSDVFCFQSTSRIYLDPVSDETRRIARSISLVLSKACGRRIRVEEYTAQAMAPGSIVLAIWDSKGSLGDEGYELTVSPEQISIYAYRPAGLFYGVQTLRQLLPPTAEKSQNEPPEPLEIPCVKIEDKPAYQWRGVLLDCARHFMTKEFIKRYIDLLAYHKLNVLHLHLTDDQGWRIEIKKFPKLMEVGAYRGEGENRYGGYYTQEDLREIVAYAESRYVNVIPEIEMPGHASAAIASYPELSCHGNPIRVSTEWGVFKDVLCPGKENTFQFLEGVIEEVVEVFPSPYIHIGGDEAPRENWKQCSWCQKRIKDENLKNEDELQSYLIRRVEKFLARQGRRLIGWDEILKGGGLPESAIVQSWRGMGGAVTGSKLGHDVIVSPYEFVYFDYPQEEDNSKPDWMSVTPLEKVYKFNPAPAGLTAKEVKHILGAECTMWTEHAPQEEVDRQLFPRLCAFSEVVWSPRERSDWEDFSKRLEWHYKRLQNLGVDYFKRGE